MTTSTLQWTDADLDRMLCAQSVISLHEPDADRWEGSDDADVREWAAACLRFQAPGLANDERDAARADLRGLVDRILGDGGVEEEIPTVRLVMN
jgi:hypothetical protein